MQSYTDVLKKNQKATGITIDDLDELSKTIDSINLGNLETGFKDVETVLGGLGQKMGKTIGDLDDEIDQMSDELKGMKVSPEPIKEFSDACSSGAEKMENFSNATEQTN
jgi:hypothetical protein